MGSFNLIDEPWMPVLDKNGVRKLVSFKDLYENAQHYLCFCGSMQIQNLVLIRLNEALISTVYSRCDIDGQPYTAGRDIKKCWTDLWRNGRFSHAVLDYLEDHRDCFYLYDDRRPFFQITQAEMDEFIKQGYERKHQKEQQKSADKGNGKKGRSTDPWPTIMRARNINRLISESGNKTAAFSPVHALSEKCIYNLPEYSDICNRHIWIRDKKDKKKFTLSEKDVLTSAEFALWLIVYQAYAGNGDKATWLKKKGQSASSGWLYRFGAVYPSGTDLFMTLMLNFVIDAQTGKPERPCWEYTGKENVLRSLRARMPDNRAELYTNWSRAVFVDPEMSVLPMKFISTVKLPRFHDITDEREPMAMYVFYAKKSEYRCWSPVYGQYLWRNFGLLTSDAERNHIAPGIWNCTRSRMRIIKERLPFITWNETYLQPDDQPASRAPVDELSDSLTLNDLLIQESEQTNGWIIRINNEVAITQKIAGDYKFFLKKLAEVRGLNTDTGKAGDLFIATQTALFYQSMNGPFLDWLASISPEDDMEDKCNSWNRVLCAIACNTARSFMEHACARDLRGKTVNGGSVANIITVYDSFERQVRQDIKSISE